MILPTKLMCNYTYSTHILHLLVHYKYMEIITIKADIHSDGDIYVEKKDGSMQLVGCIGESTFREIPDKYYSKIRKIAKLYK